MGIVPGQPGLYLFTLYSVATYYEGELISEGNECTSFHVVNKLNQSDNQTFFWDRLNRNSLELNGYPGVEIINRNNPNHFFVEVLP